MRAIIEDENADDGVKLRSYCQKHSVNQKKEKCAGSGSEEEEVKRKRRKDMTSEEKTQARAARLQEIEREFDRHVSVKDISTHLLDVDQDAINYIYNYWKLKRRAGHNRPLLPPKSDDTELLTHRQEQADLDKMKMFVQLRQDLERVRNLCYMVSRREKLSRSFFRMREQTFHKQVAVLSADASIPEQELAAIIEANHGPSIYDRLYSHPNAPDHKNDFEDLLARIAPTETGAEKKDRNGLVKSSKAANPYKKHYVNGSRRSGSMYSGLSSEESAPEITRTSRYRKAIGSSTDDEAKKTAASPKKKVSPKMAKGKRSPKKPERKKKKVPQSKALIESSSEDEALKSKMKKDRSRSKTLQQMEKEMTAAGVKLGQSGTDSDDLMPIRSTRNNKFPIDIYSDSSEDNKSDVKPDKEKLDKIKAEKDKDKKPDKVKPDKSPSGNDSQQSLPRTKAAMKEFIPTQPEKKPAIVPEEEKPAPKKRGRKPSNKEKKVTPVKNDRMESDDEAKNKENIKFSKQKDNPTDLIVPQRQAAKKASENMRSTTATKKEEGNPVPEKQTSGDDSKVKTPVKTQSSKPAKGKEMKDGPGKVGRKKSKDVEKEPIAYVPQRQAAKKAAAHIKSGLGTKPAAEADDKKKDEKSDPIKSPPGKKDDVKVSKVPPKESSSSSSNSSSSSYTSSSSSEEEPEKPSIKPTAKAREIKPAITTRQPSMFSPPGSRPTVDLPFLDKVSKPLSSTSASSDSDSSKESDRSRSDSPYPKRPRRRRKVKSISTDASPRKAPDKKLKTSERRSECRVSPTLEGEEPSRPNDARAATRARTRSVTSGGNMPNKSDARSRKPSKDDSGIAVGPDKTPKESSQPSELPVAERKEDEEVKKEPKPEPVVIEPPKNDVKSKPVKTTKRSSESAEDKEKTPTKVTPEIITPAPPNKVSPRKSTDLKQKTLINRRMSLKETVPKERPPVEEVPAREPIKRDRRLSRLETHNTSSERTSLSPVKKTRESRPEPVLEKPAIDLTDKKSPIRINADYHDNDKHWLPKAPSPHAIPPPVEKPGGNEKYMTDDKSMDSDYADKNSVKMIAKIQANLNENTMIKSPKTPMDARTMSIEHLEGDTMTRNMRKRPAEKKFITQDASHVQGVEISKSAKIPSAVNPYPNRIFSPQSKDNEIFDFELMAVDDGFNHDDIIKPFATYPEFFFKEDSKEQGVQETLNLVDRLRMQLSTKKVPVDNSAQDEPIVINDDSAKDQDDNMPDPNAVKTEQDLDPPPIKKLPVPIAPSIQVEHSPPKEVQQLTVNHVPRSESVERLPPRNLVLDNKDYDQPIPMTSNDKWSTGPVSHHDTQNQVTEDRKYEIPAYVDESKEPVNLQSDVQSMSEVADTISLSKQSDDSQSHLSVVDHSVQGDNDQDLTQDNQNYDNNDSMIHSDCATISSPYVSQEKWRESKITTRRSSASSTNSENSICSQKTDLKTRMNTIDSRPGNVMPEIDTYPPIPAYSRPVEPSMPLNQYSTYPPDASPYLSSLPLFTGPCASQLPLPSPGPLYVPYTATSLLPTKQFPLSFTNSTQNLAITTAMIAPPTPKPMDSPRDDIDVTGSDKFSIHVASSPSVSVESYETNSNRAPTKMSNDSNETMTSLHPQESKSPPKLSKSATKFPGKSPGKSPGISPKQSDAPKGTKRPSNRSNRSQRGRGRSKSRGQSGFPPVDYLGNSIASKLVGTVYDFDEEIANDGVDLKALRDKRKSIDMRDDRKSDHSYKDTSQSPRVNSPPQNNKRTPTTENKDVKAPTPEPTDPNSSPSSKVFSQVAPVLPGPVDMRTYQPFENPVPPTGETYTSSGLMAFASGTADQHLAEIDEEVEKQLHTALMASNPPTGSPGHPAPGTSEPPKEPTVTPQLPKVSLSDSRNQLKVKIKGPFLDANYSASCSTQPVVPPPPAPAHDANTAVPSTSSSMGGSTNLRRMRKKELLRQYWTQDMNMDDPSTSAAVVPPPAAPSPLTRAVITIPKAVASMTSIPTREDYKIVDTPVEKKKRKTTSGLSRELRHLEVSMNDDVDPSDDVKLSTIAGTSGTQTHKRRGRNATKTAVAATASTSRGNATSPVAPKLKIKIGANTAAVQQVPPPAPPPPREPSPPPRVPTPPRALSPQPGPSSEDPSDSNRPPKKRLIPKPSLEDLRRESMKYRRLVMAGFDGVKGKKRNKSKSEKRKKKKDKKGDKLEKLGEKLEVVNSESDSATKLIIKIKRTNESDTSRAQPSANASSAAANASATTAEPFDPFEYDPSAPDPLAIDPPSYSESSSAMRRVRTDKVTPIRLKLARSSEGSGYVMKEPSHVPPSTEPVSGPSSSPVPLPVR